MKRLLTPFGIGLAALAALLLVPGVGALAQQQTFSSVSSGAPPAPLPTPTGLSVSGVYLGIYPGYGPHQSPPPCKTGHCRPVKPVPHPPVTTRPVAPPPMPRPAPPRP
jgi:hypothetical protein